MFVPFGCTCFSSPLDILICFLIVIPAKVLPPDVLSVEEFIPHVASWTLRVLRFFTCVWTATDRELMATRGANTIFRPLLVLVDIEPKSVLL